VVSREGEEEEEEEKVEEEEERKGPMQQDHQERKGPVQVNQERKGTKSELGMTYSPIVHGPKWFPTMVSYTQLSNKNL